MKIQVVPHRKQLAATRKTIRRMRCMEIIFVFLRFTPKAQMWGVGKTVCLERRPVMHIRTFNP